jgi:hypothetical protein
LTELSGSRQRATSDFTSEKGNISMSQTSFVQFSHENVIENLQGVGISLGSNSDQISRTVDRSKKMEIERTIATKSNDIFSEVFDKVEKRNWIMRK